VVVASCAKRNMGRMDENFKKNSVVESLMGEGSVIDDVFC
jgi:hypothetical protein